MLGVPQASLRMVKEKQQLMEVSSSPESVSSELLLDMSLGLALSTQVVRTAFWFTLNATSAYFCTFRQGKGRGVQHYRAIGRTSQ